MYRGGYRLSYSLLYPKYYCTNCKQLTERESVCDNWQKRKRGYDISLQRFIQAEEDIKALIKLLVK